MEDNTLIPNSHILNDYGISKNVRIISVLSQYIHIVKWLLVHNRLYRKTCFRDYTRPYKMSTHCHIMQLGCAMVLHVRTYRYPLIL